MIVPSMRDIMGSPVHAGEPGLRVGPSRGVTLAATPLAGSVARPTG